MNRIIGGISVVLAVVFLIVGCSRYTTNSRSRVVKLRDSLIDLVEDRTNEVTDSTTLGESYVLLDGYMQPRDFDSLQLPPDLRSQLAEISPPDEKYALARITGGTVKEYTYFEHRWPRDPLNKNSPLIIASCPLLMSGASYRITKGFNSKLQVVLKVEPN